MPGPRCTAATLSLIWPNGNWMLDADAQVRHVPPEVPKAVRAPKQRGEDCRIGEQDVAAPTTFRRHPDARIELPISRRRERVRPGRVDRLPGQHVNGLRVLGR